MADLGISRVADAVGCLEGAVAEPPHRESSPWS
jgi:hypothetical protein